MRTRSFDLGVSWRVKCSTLFRMLMGGDNELVVGEGVRYGVTMGVRKAKGFFYVKSCSQHRL